MYTLSDILAVINSNLELERKRRNIEARGHFTLSSYSSSVEGGIAWDNIIRFFVDADHCYPVIRMHHVLSKELYDKKEEESHKFYMITLQELFKLLWFGSGEFSYDRFVDGTFNHVAIVE